MKNMKISHLVWPQLFAISFLLAACTGSVPTSVPAPGLPANRNLILATTTSILDSGLLDILIPDFETRTGYKVKTVAVGSGEAMKMGQVCNADVLLVHSPAAEAEFMDSNYGSDRRLVMHNDFVIVGPASDPAGIKGTSMGVEAFTRIADTQAAFISRGDTSGTHSKELAIWKDANLSPVGDWYLESGQGMGATLTIASEQAAYTLTDRATYLAYKDNLSLGILVEDDAILLNIYHVIVVNPTNCKIVNYEGAIAFADYIVSSDAQALIGGFGVEEFGAALFTQDAGKDEDALGK